MFRINLLVHVEISWTGDRNSKDLPVTEEKQITAYF